MAAYLPPEWPTGVHPPGSEEFERTAVAWLLDVVPPDYRLYGVLRRHPIALATLARRHLGACVEGARQGYRTARTELGGVLPVSGLDAVLAAYRSEGQRLVAAARAADLVEQALRGKEFTPPLHDAPGPPTPAGRVVPPVSSSQPGPPASPRQPGPAVSSGQPGPSRQPDQSVPPRQSDQPISSGQPDPPPSAPSRQPAAAGKQRQKPGAAGKQNTPGKQQKQPARGKQRRPQAVS